MVRRSTALRVTLTAALLALPGCPSTEETNDTGTTDAGRADTPATDSPASDVPGLDAPREGDPDAPPPPDGVPMFVATGKYARITTSCDDGMTWSFDRSDDDAASCVGIDCDHHPGSATGVTFGGGWFFASFGWGDNPSRIFRSANGVDWEVPYDMRGFSFAGIDWAGDRLVGGDVNPRYSLDEGSSFMQAEWPEYVVPDGAWPNSRAIGYAPYGGGRIALIAASGDGTTFSDTVVSSDGGLTYQHPTTFPDECIGHGPRLAYGGGAWVQTWGTTGAVCTSTDGGQNWTHQTLGDGSMSGALWTGSEFLLFAGGSGYRSTDGLTWTAFATNVVPGAIARNPASGTLVGLDGNSWGRPYAEQRLYRSTDGGATWDLLGETAFHHSHYLTHITFGYGASSTACP